MNLLRDLQYCYTNLPTHTIIIFFFLKTNKLIGIAFSGQKNWEGRIEIILEKLYFLGSKTLVMVVVSTWIVHDSTHVLYSTASTNDLQPLKWAPRSRRNAYSH